MAPASKTTMPQEAAVPPPTMGEAPLQSTSTLIQDIASLRPPSPLSGMRRYMKGAVPRPVRLLLASAALKRSCSVPHGEIEAAVGGSSTHVSFSVDAVSGSKVCVKSSGATTTR